MSQNLEIRRESHYLTTVALTLLRHVRYGTSSLSYLADTLVVNETQSLVKVKGVVPVISSHWAGVVPPAYGQTTHK